MKHYKTYTAKKLKFPRRLLLFIVIAALIFVVTVIIGNVLKGRLEKADIDTSEIPDAVTTASGSLTDDNTGSVSEHDQALLSVFAGCVNFSGCADANSARAAVDEVKAGGYNAVSFVVTDSSGRLTYASPAVQEASRLTASASLLTYDNLKAAITHASSLGMKASAVMTKSDGTSDVLCAAELASAGFSEILIRGFEGYKSLDNEAVTAINDYIAGLREAAGIKFGVCLSPDVYTAAYNSPYIEKIYANADFMAVDMTAYNQTSAAALAESIRGSFQAYMLRPVLEGADIAARALVAQALSAQSITAASYVSAPEKPADTTGTDTTVAQH